jgi:hypothetical protein
VEKNRSLNTTLAYSSFGTLIDIRRDGPSPMRFAPGPVLVSGGQIDLSMKPSSTDIHVAFDHTLEPGGAGISAGSSKVSSEDNAGF